MIHDTSLQTRPARWRRDIDPALNYKYRVRDDPPDLKIILSEH